MMKSKNLKLSNTAIDTYATCPYKYKLHYIEKIRPTTTGSALVFGRAVDEALNALLLTKKKALTKEEEELANKNPVDIFDEYFQQTEINSTKVITKFSDKIEYYKSDCDLSILEDEDLEELDLSMEEAEEIFEEYDMLTKAKRNVPTELVQSFANICWFSLKRKGRMLIEAYEKEILPEIVEVHSIQEKVNLPNGHGDYLIGFIDFIATFKDGKKRIVDNKTSGQAYKKDSVETSQQLSIYSEYLEIRNCAYAVVVKKLRKREPRVRTQILFGKISEDLLEETFDKVGELEYNIKKGNFPKKMDSCFHFGRKCPYYKYCRDHKNCEGLIKLNRED